MLKKGWWYVQGYASLICSGFYNPSYDDILQELRDMGSVIVHAGLKRHEDIEIKKSEK